VASDHNVRVRFLPGAQMKKIILILIPLLIFLGLFIFMQTKKTPKKEAGPPREIKVAGKSRVKYPQDFTIVMVGDSMTEKLGNSDEIRANLKKYYPDKTFEVLNYGFGSTNILSVQDRLEKKTFYSREFRPVLEIYFDLILIESFGNNPLSEFSLSEGLQKQNEALDKIVEKLKKENPKAKIAFIATIAPNKWRYGEGAVELDAGQKTAWVKERVAYIKNHIEYAQTHGIPLINVFEKSLNSDGEGNLDYLAREDYIHPSPNGVYLISDEIAKVIFDQNLLQL
jgi:lysophospholipase L1-like esterase